MMARFNGIKLGERASFPRQCKERADGNPSGRARRSPVLARFRIFFAVLDATLPLPSPFKRHDPEFENAKTRRMPAHMVESLRIGIALSGGASLSQCFAEPGRSPLLLKTEFGVGVDSVTEFDQAVTGELETLSRP